MLCMTPEDFKASVELGKELSWLEENHPEKIHLIGLARSHLNTIRMAGSCDSLTLGPDGKMVYTSGGKVTVSVPGRAQGPH